MGNTNSNVAANVAEQVLNAKVNIVCSVKSVQVYQAGDTGLRYRVTIDTMIDAIKKDSVSGEYIAAQVDYIDFIPRVLIAQCINQIEGLDHMYTKKKEQGLRNDNAAGFGAAELQVVLRGAKINIERTKFEVGDEYTDGDGVVQSHENAGYNTSVTKIKVSDKVQANLDKMFDSVFDI